MSDEDWDEAGMQAAEDYGELEQRLERALADLAVARGDRDRLGAALDGAMEAIEGEWVGLNDKLPEWAQPWADALAAWRRTGEGNADG